MNISQRIAKKFKEVREKLNINQNTISEEINEMIKNKEIDYETKNEKKPFSQTVLSYIENNFKGASKERLYILVEYYERRHGINPAYFFSYSGHEPMFSQEKFLDLTGEKINKTKIEKIIKKYIPALEKTKDEIINDILKEIH